MKKTIFICLMSCFFSPFVFAKEAVKPGRFPAGTHTAESFDAEKIYRAMNAKEYNPMPNLTKDISAKSVGGFTCLKNIVGGRAPVYECGIDMISSYCKLKSWGPAFVDDPRVPNCSAPDAMEDDKPIKSSLGR